MARRYSLRVCLLGVTVVAATLVRIRGGISGTVDNRGTPRFTPPHEADGVCGALAVTS
jgi:hypothetical protein